MRSVFLLLGLAFGFTAPSAQAKGPKAAVYCERDGVKFVPGQAECHAQVCGKDGKWTGPAKAMPCKNQAVHCWREGVRFLPGERECHNQLCMPNGAWSGAMNKKMCNNACERDGVIFRVGEMDCHDQKCGEHGWEGPMNKIMCTNTAENTRFGGTTAIPVGADDSGHVPHFDVPKAKDVHTDAPVEGGGSL